MSDCTPERPFWLNFQISITSELLGVEGWNFQGFIITTLSTNNEKTNKIWEVRVSWWVPWWFDLELPTWLFLPLLLDVTGMSITNSFLSYSYTLEFPVCRKHSFDLWSKWLVVIKRFSVCFNLFVILFLLTPYLVVALQPCMKWTQLKKELRLNKKDIYKVIHCNLLCQMTSANFFEQVEQKHHYNGVLADFGLLKDLQ